MDIRAYNREAWDRHVESGDNPWTKPVSPEVIAAARKGEWSLLLTEQKPVPRDWFPEMPGLDLLALACGGGQQGPIFAALGANVCVFDNSPKQLEQDRQVAEREGLTSLRTLEGDMRDLGVFTDEAFDFIFHPVSNLFIHEIRPVWTEAFRVLRPGGTMLAGFMNPVFYIFDYTKAEQGCMEVKFKLPYADADHPEIRSSMMSRGWPLEHSHSLTDQFAGQTDAGFQIIGMYEDQHAGTVISEYTPTYIATQALKP